MDMMLSHSADLEYESVKSENTDVRIVLLGKTGVGKSATGNTILGREAFKADLSQDSITKDCQRETAEINGRHITVIDTPGLFNTELSYEDIKREITNCISMILPGPHVFIIVLNLGQRFTQEAANSVKIIQETFGKNSLMYTMILFTRGDYLKNKNIEECLGKPGSPLMKLIEECGNRFHVFNNNETSDRAQVSLLLEKIDAMVTANGDSYYSCEMERDQHEKQIEQMKREKEELMTKHEEEKERIKIMMEEERQNYVKEMKRREERYKREIQEMKDMMRREQEERQIPEQRQRREEEERQRREEEKRQKLEQRERREEEERQRREERQKLEQRREEEKRQKLEQRQRKEEEKAKGYIGLRNQGTTCYLNSVLQTLFMTEEFRKTVESFCKPNKSISMMDSSISQLFMDLKSRKKTVATTERITAELKVNVCEQHDAAEYFQKIMNMVSPEMSKVFQGELENITTCKNPTEEHSLLTQRDSFFIIPICMETFGMDSPTNMQSCFDSYFEPIKMHEDDQMYCTTCQEMVKTETKCNLLELPSVLVVQLQRFELDYNTKKYKKNNSAVEIDFQLSVKDNSGVQHKYDLYAVVNHFGYFDDGLYYVVIKSFEDQQWYQFMDDKVHKVHKIYGLENPFHSNEAFLLLYKKNDIKGCTKVGDNPPGASWI